MIEEDREKELRTAGRKAYKQGYRNRPPRDLTHEEASKWRDGWHSPRDEQYERELRRYEECD